MLTTLIACFTVGTLGASADLRLPTSPIQPTAEDCGRLQLAYLEIHRSYSEQSRSCYAGDPRIGPGELVGRDCSVRSATRAYPQCASYDRQLCEIHESSKRESATCMGRVRAASDQQQQLKSANDAYEQATTTFEKGRLLLSDPKRLFQQIAAQDLLDRAFPTGKPPRYEIADEALRYAHNLATAGIDQLGSTRSPLIGGIQKEVFEQLAVALGDSLENMDLAMSMIESFSVEYDRHWREASSARPAPVTYPSYQSDARLCAQLGTCD